MNRNFKILFIAADKFPPFRADISSLFADKLVKKGYKIDWLLQSETNCSSSYTTEWHGGNAFVGPADNGASFLRRLKKNIQNLLHDLTVFHHTTARTYDFVVVRDKFIAALFAILASKIAKFNFIFWLSYPFPESDLYEIKDGTARYPILYFIRGHFRKFVLYNIIFPLSAHVFVQTPYMKSVIVRCYGMPAKKMTPVPMGVNMEKIPYFGYSNNGEPQNRKKIVYLGTLLKTRKLDFLIRVFHKVKIQFEQADLILVGGGEDEADERLLISEIKNLGLTDSVKMTGMLPQKEAWQYLKEADVCVSPICPSPILDCGSPTKLIEYMAMGKAVVANDHPEQKEILTECPAGICVPWEEDAFANAILKLLVDPEICASFGLQGRDFIAKHRSYTAISEIVHRKLNSIFHLQ